MQSIQDRARAFQARLAASGPTPAAPIPAPVAPQAQPTTGPSRPVSRSPLIPGAFPQTYQNALSTTVPSQVASLFHAPSSPPHGPSNPASVESLSREQVRSSLATDQIKFLEKRLQDQTLETIRLKESLRDHADEAVRGKAEIGRLRNRETELMGELEASQKQAVEKRSQRAQPMTFTRFDELKDAYATFCADEIGRAHV